MISCKQRTFNHKGLTIASTSTRFCDDRVTGEWNDSRTGEFLWSNINVSEAVPDVITPSTWSLWRNHRYDANPIKMPGHIPFCRNICGCPYLNLSLLVSMYQAIGRGARKQLQGDMIGSAPANLDIPTMRLSAFSVYRTVLPGSIKGYMWAKSRHGMMKFFSSILLGFFPAVIITLSIRLNCRKIVIAKRT